MNGPWKVYFEISEYEIDAVKTFLETINENSTRAIWYYHPAGKQGKGRHIHGLLFDYPTTAETLRNKIKKQFNLTDKKQYGISNKYERGTIMTEEKVSKYIVYMTKGEHDPVCYKGYEQPEIAEYKSQFIKPALHIHGDLIIEANAVKVKNKKTQWELAQEAQQRYVELYPQSFQLNNGFQVKKLILITIGLMKENRQLAHKRAVLNIIQDIIADLDTNMYACQILSMV